MGNEEDVPERELSGGGTFVNLDLIRENTGKYAIGSHAQVEEARGRSYSPACLGSAVSHDTGYEYPLADLTISLLIPLMHQARFANL